MSRHLIFISILFILSSFKTTAQQSLSVVELEASISGTSTMHDWTSHVNEFNLEGQIIMEEKLIKSFENIKVVIPAKSIKSDRGNLMDRNTWNALQADEHPTIEFTLSETTVSKNADESYLIKALGELTLVGHSKTTEIDLTASFNQASELTIKGSKEILMSDYEMEAPSFLFGAYSTGDLVTFDFEVKLAITP